MKYVVEKEFTGSYNVNFLVHEEENPSEKWVAKVSIEIGPGFKDLNGRALLAYRLSQLAGVRLAETVIAPLNCCVGLEKLSEASRTRIAQYKIDEDVILTKHVGVGIPKFLGGGGVSDLEDNEEILKSFVFNLWIGNYDRKVEDYLVTKDGTIVSIDYQLCGPGFVEGEGLSIGACAQGYSLDNSEDTGWCLEGRLDNKIGILLGYVRSQRFSYQDFESTVQKIKEISHEDIGRTFKGLSFFGQHETEINMDFKEFLFSRQDRLQNVIEKWIKDGYPVKKMVW